MKETNSSSYAPKHRGLWISAVLLTVAGLIIGTFAVNQTSTGVYVAQPQVATETPEVATGTSNVVTSSAPVSTKSSSTVTPKAPAPSSTPAPVSLPVPMTGPNNSFGISDGSIYALDQAALDAEMADIASLGVGRMRVDLPWSTVQWRGPNSYQWGAVDRIVAAANTYHLKLLFILDAPPKWAVASGCSPSMSCAPQDPTMFATFAAAAVTRYAPEGVHDWEIWNEENMASNWLPAANAGAYTALLQAVYPQIKAADPSAVIITGGLAPAATGNGTISPTDFLSGIYSAGGQGYFDAVGDHPYSYPVPPSVVESWSGWSQMDTTPVSLRSIMTANGDGNKQIWITEYGAPTGGPGAEAQLDNYDLNGSPDHVDEALQADMLTEAVSVVRTQPWIAALFWYSYKDLGTNPSTNENFFGLLRYDGSQKPAYAAFKEALTTP